MVTVYAWILIKNNFTSPFEAYEFANFHKMEGSEVILFSSNWLDPNDYSSNIDLLRSTLNYWWLRLSPFISEDNCTKSNKYFVWANRIGTERDTSYVGWSWILKGNKDGCDLVDYKFQQNKVVICQILEL